MTITPVIIISINNDDGDVDNTNNDNEDCNGDDDNV
jgi:hypothetical protein